MYTFTTGSQPSNWFVMSTLIPPTPVPTKGIFPAFTMMLSFFIIIVFIHFVLTKLFFVFFFSVFVLVLFSNEHPPLKMLN